MCVAGQIIPFGVAPGDRLDNEVAERIGGYFAAADVASMGATTHICR